MNKLINHENPEYVGKLNSIVYEEDGLQVCAVCQNPIGDFKDDCGYFYSMYNGEYVAKCRECFGPLTGDR